MSGLKDTVIAFEDYETENEPMRRVRFMKSFKVWDKIPSILLLEEQRKDLKICNVKS